MERRSAFGAPDSLAVSPFQRFSVSCRASSFEVWMALVDGHPSVPSLAVGASPKTEKRRVEARARRTVRVPPREPLPPGLCLLLFSLFGCSSSPQL